MILSEISKLTVLVCGETSLHLLKSKYW